MSIHRPKATNIAVKVDTQSGGGLTVEWSDGARSTYPAIYLRDNSWDSKTANGQRLFETFELNPNQLRIHEHVVDEEAEVLKIKWSDEEVSTFSMDWLFDNSCSDTHRTQRNQETIQRVALWDRQTLSSPRTVCKYDEVEQNKIEIYKELRKYGVCLVEGAPTTEVYDEKTGDPPITAVGNVLGFVRETNYGRHFDVRVEPRQRDAGHLAYTTKGLSVHTDNPYRVPTPGVQLLHCIKQAPPMDGNDGMSVLIDGFAVANVMREQYPEEFALLSTIKRPFTYYDLNGGYKFHCDRFVIGVGAHGNVESVHYNNRSASSHNWNIEESQIEPYYRAWTLFGAMLDDPKREYAMDYRLEPGQMVVFDNNRVLHGRRGYTLATDSENEVDEARHLQGCYIDFDSVWGRLDGYEYQQQTNGVNGANGQ